MNERDWTAKRFEEHRPRLQAVAYRMLGSRSEAEDAVQETWIRLSRSSTAEIRDLEAWLLTVVGRVSLNMLRARRTHCEEPLDDAPDPVAEERDPEREAVLADSVGIALLVVLETLTPAERLAYVLHDMFSVRFDEIGSILGRAPEAARQLASRGRRKVRGASPTARTTPAADRAVVDAFLAAARDGDFGALVAVLDPEIVLRADTEEGVVEVRGAETVAQRARSYAELGLVARPVLVDGIPAWASTRDGELFSVAAFGVRDGRIVTMDFLADPERLSRLEVVFLDA